MTNNVFIDIMLGIFVFIILYLIFLLLVKLPIENYKDEKLLDEIFGTSHNSKKKKTINRVDNDETPTINTVQYPKDFFSCADGVSIKDAEINKWVKECVNDLNKDTDYSYRASGDTIVFAYKSDESLPAATVIVAKKYEETDVKIPQKNF